MDGRTDCGTATHQEYLAHTQGGSTEHFELDMGSQVRITKLRIANRKGTQYGTPRGQGVKIMVSAAEQPSYIATWVTCAGPLNLDPSGSGDLLE
jgi:hypothetical protein